MTVALRIITLAAALALPLPLAAQTVAGPPAGVIPPSTRDSLTIGLGGGIAPDYEGANEGVFQPGGVMQGKLDGFEFQMRGTNVFLDLVRDAPGARTTLAFGPVAQVRLERTGKVHDSQVAALGDRATAVELGAYLGLGKRGVLIPPDSVNLEVAVVHDVAGAHGSTIISPSLSYSTPLSHRTYVRLILSADHVGEGYGRTYFEVTPAGAAASGLRPYAIKGGGLKNAGVTALLVQDLGGNPRGGVGLFGLAGYKRLLGKYADSPVVRDVGSANQGFAVAGLTYSF